MIADYTFKIIPLLLQTTALKSCYYFSVNKWMLSGVTQAPSFITMLY